MAPLKSLHRDNCRSPRSLLSVLLLCLPAIGSAQQIASVAERSNALPDAPSFALQQQSPTSEPQGTGNISGTVLDIHEDLVPNAKVTLVEEGKPERTALSDGAGDFIFTGLAGGRYRLTITSPGLETFVSPEIVLRPGEHRELPRIALPLATANVEVQVTVTQVEIAQEQIKLQEKQRVLGVLPNFYTSYLWDAAPMNTRQKFGLAFHSVTDPVIFPVTGLAAGIEQARNTFPAYGQGAKGYAKRFGADYADEFSNRMFSSAIFPAIFHQDPRYFYKGTGSKKSRAWYAITRAVITRGDNGHAEFNYSRILGGFASGSLSNAYHLGDDRGVGLTLRNGFIAIGGHAADNLLREFLFKAIVPKIPDYEKGEPANAANPVKPQK